MPAGQQAPGHRAEPFPARPAAPVAMGLDLMKETSVEVTWRSQGILHTLRVTEGHRVRPCTHGHREEAESLDQGVGPSRE